MKWAAAKTKSSLVTATRNSPLVGMPGNLRRRLFSARGHPPHLVRQPLQALLGVFQLLGGHVARAAADLPGVTQELVQDFPQGAVFPALCRGFPLGRAHAVWIPKARSSAWRSSAAAARMVAAIPPPSR